jgi:hypothetical protein
MTRVVMSMLNGCVELGKQNPSDFQTVVNLKIITELNS